ncbi:MAG: glycosyltransferase family 2 protein [Candidatus Shapirobacteria bacterium]|nr:glycosyltransferase family 2 protein [Candidatus Shapirobacteria bacterium]MDD3002454.1 glycosyltransferase family 2 protein [Candidatus Shapirobacteria bacterium]MDD4383357.1 glycosyltransferase family 2 protein [Candidatus Shapirobacteria bacterium]
MKKIAIIVLNWKQAKLTIETITSVLKIKHDSFDYQIILVDNGSSDDSLKIFNQEYKNNKLVKIINTKGNYGYAGGNNFGIDYALKNKFDFLVLLNNDVLVKPNFLEELLKESTNYDIIGPKIYFAPGFEYHKDRYQKKDLGKVIWSMGGQIDWNNIYGSNISIDEVDNDQFNKIINNVDFISGCCLMASRQVFQKIGKLDENYFMYFEDVDFCQRAKNAGFKMACIPKSIIWHLNSGSTNGPGNLQNYFITRNRIYFAYKYAKTRTKFAIFRESLKILFSKSRWQKQAIIDIYSNKMNKGSWK